MLKVGDCTADRDGSEGWGGAISPASAQIVVAVQNQKTKMVLRSYNSAVRVTRVDRVPSSECTGHVVDGCVPRATTSWFLRPL